MGRILWMVLLLAVAVTTAVVAQAPPGVPVKSGQATFTLDGTATTYTQVTGTFNEGYGFHTIGLTFTKDGKPAGDNLQVSLMIQKTGAVDLNQPMGNGIGLRKAMTLYSYQKGKSRCTMTVTVVSATSVEGSAECPVLNEVNGQRTVAVTAVKFSATAK